MGRPMRVELGRALGVGILLAATAASAGVTVPPFVTPDDLGIFGPTVAKAFAAALDLQGVDVSAGVPVAGRIETLDHDRVRLRATVAGHTAQVEGELERIDVLTAELGSRLAPQLPASVRRPPGSPPRLAAPRPTPVPPPSLPLKPTATPPSSPTPAPPPPPRVDKSPSVPPPTVSVSLPPVVAPPLSDEKKSVSPSPPLASNEEHASAPPPVVEERHFAPPPPPLTVPPPPIYPTAPAPAPTAYVAPPGYPPPRRGWRPSPFGAPLGRVVLHTIGAPDGCAVGQWATYAARDVLERRLHVQTVVGGCGFVPPGTAAAEAARARVRAVVMAAFVEPVRLEPAGGNLLRPVGRLRVIVVRDGQVVYDRTPPLSPRLTQVPDPSRAAYDLVEEAFGRLGGELQTVLLDAR